MKIKKIFSRTAFLISFFFAIVFLLAGFNGDAEAKVKPQIAAGGEHTIAIKSDGTLWAWGYNGAGQLGDGTYINKSSPVQIGTDYKWVSIAAGGLHTAAFRHGLMVEGRR